MYEYDVSGYANPAKLINFFAVTELAAGAASLFPTRPVFGSHARSGHADIFDILQFLSL